MKTKKYGRGGFMAMKLDMSKAYNKVDLPREHYVENGLS